MVLGLGLHFLHDGEGPPHRAARTGADEVHIAGQLLDHVLRESEVAVDGVGHAELQHLRIERHLVVQEIHVSDHDDHALGLRFLERVRGGGFLLVLLLAFGGRLGGFAFGERGFEFALQPDGHRVFRPRSLEVIHRLLRLHPRGDAFDELGLLGRVQQNGLLQPRRRSAGKGARLDE